jgi:Ca2+-binding RTX toxin-like protein
MEAIMAIQNIYVTEGTSLGVNDYLGKQVTGWVHRPAQQPGSIVVQDSQYTFVADMIDGGGNTHVYVLSTASADIAVRFVITENTLGTPDVGNGKDNALKGTMNGDVLVGRNGSDRLTGLLGDDILDGGAGNDKIDGGGGNDTLTGFTGKDTFVFAAGSGNDTITDFELGLDVITFAGKRLEARDLFFDSTETTDGVLLTFDSGDTVLLQDVHFTA